jgi:hypothetical protein
MIRPLLGCHHWNDTVESCWNRLGVAESAIMMRLCRDGRKARHVSKPSKLAVFSPMLGALSMCNKLTDAEMVDALDLLATFLATQQAHEDALALLRGELAQLDG